MAAGAGEAVAAAGAVGAGAAAGAAEVMAAAARPSEGGASALIGFDRCTWGRNRNPPLVLTMFPAKEGEKG